VVATGVCGFAHYIEQADAGVVLCEPFVQGQLNEVLAAALHDADQRARWSANGVAFGVAHTELYNMPAKAMQYIEEKVRELSA
jgi:UDP-glucose:(heptosyl)LPS alpha-1,3-glucosyltransferase